MNFCSSSVVDFREHLALGVVNFLAIRLLEPMGFHPLPSDCQLSVQCANYPFDHPSPTHWANGLSILGYVVTGL